MATLRYLGGGKVQADAVYGRGFGRVQITLDSNLLMQMPTFLAFLKQLGVAMEVVAKRLVPYDTGELHDSIVGGARTRNGKPEAYVVASAPHWAFVEYGTGLVGQATAQDIAGITTPAGWAYDYAGQGWIGMPAQPYLRPAMLIAGQFLQAGKAGF